MTPESFEESARLDRGRMLYGASDQAQVVERRARGEGKSFEREIGGLAAAAVKYDLRQMGAEQPRNLRSGTLDRHAGGGTVFVGARGIAEPGPHERFHRFCHRRIERGGGVVVEVDRGLALGTRFGRNRRGL